jgi:hypothetical protein
MNEFGIVNPAPPAVVLEHPPHAHADEYLTAVVLGLPFGGTSMVTVVVDALGVPVVKDDAWWFAYESAAFNNVDMAGLAESVGRHNQTRAVWGYKDPHARRFPPDQMHAVLRNPHYLIATKDLASMVSRVVQNPVRDDGGTPLVRLDDQAHKHLDFLQWVLRLPSAPKLLVSYHAGIRSPAELCRIIADFLHLTPTAEQMQRAIARISPAGGYLTKEGAADAAST